MAALKVLPVTGDMPDNQAEHTRRTREAYDRLAAVLGAFADAGFKVDRVAEPQPSAEALRLFPDDLGPVVGVPSFIVYRLWLQP
jgi:hypothetical protein